jgi:pyridoxamine 5'-phosphate oxidase-like protein
VTDLAGTELPPKLLDYLGSLGKHKGKVLLALTTDRKGWPHVAMLSHWEIFARTTKDMRIATYASSRTTENLLRTGKVTMVLIDRGMAYYIEGAASPRGTQARLSNRFFDVKVQRVLRDELPGARITSGIRYTEDKEVEPHRSLRKELEMP